MSETRISRRDFVGATIGATGLAAMPKVGVAELGGQGTTLVVGSVPGAAPGRGKDAIRTTLTAARSAGVGVAIVPAIGEERGATITSLLRWTRLIAELPDLAFVATDVAQWSASARGRVAVVGAAHGLQWIGRNLELLADAKAAGLRMVRLTSGWRNLAADGGCEASNLGLNSFGRRAVAALNRAGLVIDLANTGEKSSLEAMKLTRAPVVFSAANARAVHDHPLNLTDEQIRACAATGGVIGVSAFPTLVGPGEPTVADLRRHIDHIAGLVGIEHVALGLDFDAPNRKRYPDDPWPDHPFRYPKGIGGFAEIGGLGGKTGNWETVFRRAAG